MDLQTSDFNKRGSKWRECRNGLPLPDIDAEKLCWVYCYFGLSLQVARFWRKMGRTYFC